MKLEVLRFSSENDSTNGLLFDVTNGRRFLCYTLEDEHRDVKKYGETRVPAGTYRITLRTVGGFHGRYLKKYGEVPNFEYILIHTGNTDEHTAGCLLLGDTQQTNFEWSDGFVGRSVVAYKRVYPKIAAALVAGEEVTITYTDFDSLD
jgi:hypothetical protein